MSMPPEIPPPTPASTPTTMRAIVLIGHGGPEMLQLRHDVPVPKPHSDQVLIQVLAAGINNTDVNTRIGWYAKGYGDGGEASGWAGGLQFPRIQGADACGRIVAVGDGVSTQRIGERVIVATMQQDPTGTPFSTVTLGSEMDGAFAEYLVARSSETFAVSSDWSDAELASVPCAMSTAENLLRRVQLTAGERVLITGASGGVGTAAVQLARARGALVAAVAQGSKREALVQLGAHEVIDRDASLVDVITAESVDVVVDVVGGPSWPLLLDVLRRGGRYVTSGAIAGPMVELDLRTLYLKDLTLLGATYQEPDVLPSVIAHIEQGRIRPLVHATYPLADIAAAQTAFLAKDYVGKLVLIP